MHKKVHLDLSIFKITGGGRMELTDLMSSERWKLLAEETHVRFGLNGGIKETLRL